MFCSKCGTYNDAQAKFCAKCGNPLVIETLTFPNDLINENVTNNNPSLGSITPNNNLIIPVLITNQLTI